MMPVSYERKLFKVGEGGVAVTLPKAWINYYGLKPGDKVEIIIEGELVVRVSTKEEILLQ